MSISTSAAAIRLRIGRATPKQRAHQLREQEGTETPANTASALHPVPTRLVYLHGIRAECQRTRLGGALPNLRDDPSCRRGERERERADNAIRS